MMFNKLLSILFIVLFCGLTFLPLNSFAGNNGNKQRRQIHIGANIIWNGTRWVPAHYIGIEDLVDGNRPGDRCVWSGNDWDCNLVEDEGGVVNIIAGDGLLVDGEPDGVIINNSTLSIDIGITSNKIPYINDQSELVVDGYIKTNFGGIVFPDGTVQVTASEGIVGPQGVAGADGLIGPQGIAGPLGPQGVAGADGLIGPQGIAGPIGPQGVVGADGLMGPQGIAGPIGPQGVAGINGEEGLIGPIGPQGVAGINGAAGLMGPAGPQGLQGVAGEPGSDATMEFNIGEGLISSSETNRVSNGDSIYVNTGVSAGQIPKIGSNGKLPTSIIPVSEASISEIQVVYIKEVKPSGVNGGVCNTNAWNIRELNTIEGNEIFATLSSNNITLTEGTYDFYASAPAFVTAGHKAKLRNITTGVDEIIGSNGFSNNVYATLSFTYISGTITVITPTVFQIQHRCQVSSSVGFGFANGFGVSEVYTQVKITKLK